MSDFLFNLALFFIILSILVFVHEWGHFIFARIFKVKVEEFGIGIPPKIMTLFKYGDTEYTLNAIPLGGFVRMLGQDDFDAKAAIKVSDDPNSFENKPAFARAIIICAGVFMNFVFAIFLLTIVFSNGGYSIVQDDINNTNGLRINVVLSGSIAEQNNVLPGDVLYKVNDQIIYGIHQLRKIHNEIAGKETKFVFLRNGNEIEKYIIPDLSGKIGIGLRSNPLYLSLPDAFVFAIKETLYIAKYTVIGVKDLVYGLIFDQKLSDDVGGPVKIFEMTSVAGKFGLISILTFMAILSISLGIINILPFPALDGGRFIFVLVEGILRRRIVSHKLEGYIHIVGFVLLIMLIVVVTWKDILSLL